MSQSSIVCLMDRVELVRSAAYWKGRAHLFRLAIRFKASSASIGSWWLRILCVPLRMLTAVSKAIIEVS